jgi:predicted CoA-binding protein
MSISPNTPITLVVGASPNPERYAFKAITQLRQHYHEVYAFGPRSGTVSGVEIQHTLPNTNEIDTITLYVGPERQTELIDPLINLHPRRIIFNPGTENPAFETKARAVGIQTEQACTLVLLATQTY